MNTVNYVTQEDIFTWFKKDVGGIRSRSPKNEMVTRLSIGRHKCLNETRAGEHLLGYVQTVLNWQSCSDRPGPPIKTGLEPPLCSILWAVWWWLFLALRRKETAKSMDKESVCSTTDCFSLRVVLTSAEMRSWIAQHLLWIWNVFSKC